MGRKSTKENKNILQLAREEVNIARERVEEKTSITAKVLSSLENDERTARPDEVIELAKLYQKPELCNHYCSEMCEIGKMYVPKVECVSDLPKITLGLISSLNSLAKFKDRFIEISADGEIDEDEQEDFVLFKSHLDELSLAIESLRLWEIK